MTYWKILALKSCTEGIGNNIIRSVMDIEGDIMETDERKD